MEGAMLPRIEALAPFEIKLRTDAGCKPIYVQQWVMQPNLSKPFQIQAPARHDPTCFGLCTSFKGVDMYHWQLPAGPSSWVECSSEGIQELSCIHSVKEYTT
jgi:hypothetical protein